jgi:hypothetical protein
MEIGDCCASALDESYRLYAAFVVKTYSIAPAPMSVWIRASRGISNRSRRGSGGVVLMSGPEHRKRQKERAREAASALPRLIEA